MNGKKTIEETITELKAERDKALADLAACRAALAECAEAIRCLTAYASIRYGKELDCQCEAECRVCIGCVVSEALAAAGRAGDVE